MLLKRFRDNESGNVIMILALSILPLLAVAGFAIDFSRMYSAKVQLRASLDNAVLSAAKINTVGNPEELVDNWVRSQMDTNGFGDFAIDVNTNADVNRNARNISASATIELPMLVMQVFGRESAEITVNSVAVQDIPNVEVALVLDISSSMAGSKLRNLKPAATSFVDTMLEGDAETSTSISIVPYGGTVNIGNDLFERFAVSEDDASTIVDPTESEYSIGADVAEGAFRFTGANTCIEAQRGDYNDQQMPRRSRSQVPNFWVWWNVHSWCPADESSVLLNSNDAQALGNHIDDLVLSDGTGMDIGAMWGLKFLSPDFQGDLGGNFNERPLAYDAPNAHKFMVIMTDGDITQQLRPEDASRENTHTNQANRNPNARSRRGRGNRRNEQSTVAKGNENARSNQNNAVGRFKNVCEMAEENGIRVFTIGFQIRRGSLADEILQDCVSSPEDYFLIQGSDLTETFGAIAAEITSLRLAG